MNAPLTIIGSGMAGIGLLRQWRALEAERPVTLISADSGDDYAKPLLSTGFAKGLSPARLAAGSALDVADRLGAVVRTHARVDAIDLDSRTLRLGKERLPFGDLVLATGAAPTLPFAIPSRVASRVFTINDLDDYRRFHAALAALGRPARVAIIGAGLVGCEFANDLTAGGHAVSLVAPESAPLPRLLPERLGRALGEAFQAAGMQLYFGRGLAALEEGGGHVGVALSDTSRLEVDLVLAATGLTPRSALAEAAGLAVSEAGIHTDNTLATSAEGVYALGDVACVAGVNAMYVQPLQASAKALARSLAGTPTAVTFGAWPVVVKTPLLPVVAYAPTTPPARWRVEGEGSDLTALAEDVNGRLIGFALTGRCVRRKVELARLAPPLLG